MDRIVDIRLSKQEQFIKCAPKEVKVFLDIEAQVGKKRIFPTILCVVKQDEGFDLKLYFPGNGESGRRFIALAETEDFSKRLTKFLEKLTDALEMSLNNDYLT